MTKLLAVLALFGLFSGTLRAQQTDVDMQLQDQLQNLLEGVLQEDENADTEQFLSELQQLADQPVMVNLATAEDMQALFFLTPLQIEALLDYRHRFGPLLSVYELGAVDGFTPDLARLTARFLDFSADFSVRKTKRTKQELVLRATRLLEQQAGFKNGRFAGSPEKLYLRYRFTSSRMQMGYTGEKDAGECFRQHSGLPRLDYNSAFLRWQPGHGRLAVMAGDYVVQWGQGLTVWQGFAMGKPTDVEHIARFNQGVKPYASTDENNFMRGLAADWRLGKFGLQTFVSYKKFDAHTDSLAEGNVFRSMQTSGLHRTESEIEDKNSVSAQVAGTHLSWKSGTLDLGLSAMQTRFGLPLVRDDELYNQFLFQGKQVSNLGVDYRCSLDKVYLFGEWAVSSGSGRAILNGFLFQPADQAGVAVLYRNIRKNYNSPFASAFTENSRVNDEQGLYLGLRLYPAARLSLNAYADFFQYNWIKYTTAAPGKGHEMMLRTDYRLNSDWQLCGRYVYELKPLKISDAEMRLNKDQLRQSFRLQMSGQINPVFSLRTRFEHSFYTHDHYADGYLISQDFVFQSPEASSKLYLRLAYFNTGDYDARIYIYENDLLYQFSIPAFYGEGIRAYADAKVKICEKIQCWMKCSRTWFFDVNSLGSGDTAIDDSTRTELKLQLRFTI